MVSDQESHIIRSQEHEINLLRKQLSEQKKYMDSVHETTIGLIRRFSLNELLDNILTRAGDIAETPDTFLYLYDKETDELVVKQGQGVYVDLIGARIQPDQGLAGRVYQSGKPFLIDCYASWPNRIDHPLYRSLQSALGIPLKSATRTIGVIGLGSFDSAKPFSQNDLENMRRFAELASVAFENSRLHTNLQKELKERELAEKSVRHLNAELEQRVAERTSELEKALEELKTMSGILPICSHCKVIRDDKGYWIKLEEYIESRSEAEFTHSICDDCLKKYYPEDD